MNMMLWFVLLIVITSIIVGMIGFIEVELMIEFKSLNNPYFKLGVSFNEYPTEDPGFIEQELTIGLFLINIVVVFYKANN